MNDLISRQAAIDAINKAFKHVFEWDGTDPLGRKVLKDVPSAQPPTDEWCTDCKEYDQKAHCCHRFGKVIRKTVEELQVVRCKDCIHDNACAIQNAAHTGEWFYCGFGERGEKNG